MLWSEIWSGRAFAPKAIRTVLTPASWLYTLGWNAYSSIYRAGLKKCEHPHKPILCIGNLTVGGSGKTPLVIYLVEVLGQLKKDVVIGCSGYGSPASRGANLAPEGDLSALKWGDEAALLRWKLKNVPLIVGRDRVRSAAICHQNFPNAVFLMDDGFQHLPLAKDIVILVEPPGSNRRCLPAGPYREPWYHHSRADLVLPVGARHAAHRSEQGEESQRKRFRAVNGPTRLTDAQNGLEAVQPPTANVLCALGSPERFLESLKRMGVQVKQAKELPDHDPLQEGNLFNELASGEPLIVTLKDWVKLRERQDLQGRTILIADYEVCTEPEDEFKAWLLKRLDEVEKKAD